jgi:hypothetical protein
MSINRRNEEIFTRQMQCGIVFSVNDRLKDRKEEEAVKTIMSSLAMVLLVFAAVIPGADAGSNILWIHNGVPICTAPEDQWEPQIVGDGFGGAIIAWHDYGDGSTDIYARRVDANGDTLWAADGVPICTAADDQESHQLVGDGSGGAIITWQDYRGGTSDIYAQRVDANGDTLWAANGVPICTAANLQFIPKLVADGFGGAIITWQDYRGGSNYDVYAQRVDANGNTLWRFNGAAICTAASHQRFIQLTDDGIGGAIITWRDERSGSNYDIYAQRVDANGNTLWAADGVIICTAADYHYDPQIISDGFGGAVITWYDNRSGKSDIYAQWVNANGNILWPAIGEAICTAADYQYYPQLVGDGAEGAIITWEDNRSGNYDIYAQRIIGPAPRIVSISDVPNDQGREVSILWDRSYLDDPQYMLITDYTIWRKYPLGSKIESFGVEWDGSLPKDLIQRVYLRIEREDGKTEYWELIGTVEAAYLEGYAYIAPTLEDSSTSGAPYFSFFVSANTADPFVHWPSDPDSGYSVDDINPAKTQVTAIAAGGAKGAVNTIWLAWDQVTTGEDGSPEKGAIRYRVYCDTHPSFTPGAGNMLAETASLSYLHTDARIGDPAANLFYLVTVTDGSDNESAVSNRVGEFDKSLSAAK